MTTDYNMGRKTGSSKVFLENSYVFLYSIMTCLFLSREYKHLEGMDTIMLYMCTVSYAHRICRLKTLLITEQALNS